MRTFPGTCAPALALFLVLALGFVAAFLAAVTSAHGHAGQ